MAGWNGFGVFTRLYSWVADRDASIKIMATRMDGEFDNYQGGLNNCLTLDGQNSPTANISWGTKKITNLGTPTGAADAATKGYVDTLVSVRTLVQAYSPTVTCPTGAASYTTFTGYTEVSAPLDPNNEFNSTTGVFTAAQRGVYRFHLDFQMNRGGATVAVGQRLNFGLDSTAGGQVSSQNSGIDVVSATFFTDSSSLEFVVKMNAAATMLVWMGSGTGMTYTGGPMTAAVRSLIIEAMYYY